jgi:hypothetical protein
MWVGNSVMSWPSKVMRARRAENRHHGRRLAGAVGPDQGDDLALVHVDVDAPQRLDFAVEGLDPAQLQERRRKRGDSRNAHCSNSFSICSTSSSSATPR